MEYEVYVQNTETGNTFDIARLCGRITHSMYFENQPGKIELMIYKDPVNDLKLIPGSIISFIVDREGTFFGRITDLGKDKKETYKIEAFDRAILLKNPFNAVTQNQTSSQIFDFVCTQENIPHSIKFNSNFILPLRKHDKKTGYAVIQHGIQSALNGAAEFAFVKDEFGTLTFSELSLEKTDFIIGDESLMISYKYEESISKDTFNEIVVFKEDKKLGKRFSWVAKDSSTIDKWGRFRLLHQVDNDMNEGRIAELTNNFLKAKNRITKSLRFNCLGIKGMKPGHGFLLDLKSLDIKEWLWAVNVTHIYSSDLHLMEIEARI